MQTEQLARMFDKAHRESGCWRAICPVHQGGARYGRSLAIYAKDDRSIVVCYSGCSADDILKCVGLTWKDTLYEKRDSRAWRALQRVRRAEEADEYRGRIRNLVVLFANVGYKTRDRDMRVVCATALIMALGGEKPHLRKILAIHMERITAANLLRGILP